MYLTIIVAIHAENEGDLVIYKVLYDENKGVLRPSVCLCSLRVLFGLNEKS